MVVCYKVLLGNHGGLLRNEIHSVELVSQYPGYLVIGYYKCRLVANRKDIFTIIKDYDSFLLLFCFHSH
jgi:hypothetical protein